MKQLNLKNKAHDLRQTLDDIGMLILGLKSEKGEYLFADAIGTIITFIIFSYKRFDDILSHDKDALIKIPEKCRWNHLLKHSSDYFELIAANIKEISALNPCLSGLDEAFNISQYNKLAPTDIQKNIIDIFTDIDLSESNYSANEITRTVTEFIESAYGWGLEDDSPYGINNLAIHLLDPKEGNSFYHPNCRFGNGIVAAINYLHGKAILNNNSQEINQILSSTRLYGYESGEYYVLALLRLALMNINIKLIENVSSFEKNIPDEPKPSIIFVNPYNLFTPSKKNLVIPYEDDKLIIPKAFAGEIYCLFKSLMKLAETGRMGIIIPEAILFAESTKKIRKLLVEKDYLEAIISELDGPVLLILNKNKGLSRKGKVAFIKAKNSFNTPAQFSDVLSDFDFDSGFPITMKEINRITDIYNSFKTVDEKDAIVTLEHIRLLKYNLSSEYYSANLAAIINLYGNDNIAFVELSDLIEEIKGAKTYDEKTPADLDPSVGWTNEAFLNDHVAADAVSISSEDLINNLSAPYIKSGVFSKKAPSFFISKNSVISQKCILVSLSEISRLSSNLPAFLPTLFDPEKILKDTTFIVENTDHSRLFFTKQLTSLIPKETKIGLEYLYYTLFVPFVYEQLLTVKSIASLKSIRLPMHKSLKRQQEFLPTLKQYILDLEKEKQKASREKSKAEDEKKEDEFETVSMIRHSYNNRIGEVVWPFVEDMYKFIQRKGLNVLEPLKNNTIKDSYSIAINELNQMRLVIEDSRDFIEKGMSHEEFKSVDLKELFESRIFAKYKGDNFKIIFDCSDGIKAVLRENSFIEAMDNIIKNASVHGFKNKDADNEIFFWIYDVKNEIIIDCANNGVKIPSDIKEADYLKFGVTGDASNGTGIGGAYVKRMLKAHNVKFEIIREKSKKRKPIEDSWDLKHGAYFRFRMPQGRSNE